MASKGYPQKFMYYGLRGVGKTVLLNAIEEKAEEKDIELSQEAASDAIVEPARELF